MTILVTGAAGFIGRHFAVMQHYFASQATRKLVCVDKVPQAPGVLDAYDYMSVDLTSVNEVVDLFLKTKPTTVVHLAAVSRVGEAADANKAVVRNLFEAAARLPELPQFVFAGSAAEYGALGLTADLPKEGSPLHPVDSYAHSKVVCYILSQQFADSSRCPVAWLRFANVYGPAQDPDKLYHFIPSVIDSVYRGSPVILHAKGLPRRQFVYVTDICRALWLVTANRFSGVFNFGGDELSMGEAAHITTTAVHDYLLRHNTMLRPAVFDLRDEGGGAMRVGVDSTKALSELGWSPLVGFYEGIRRTVVERIQGDLRNENRKALSA